MVGNGSLRPIPETGHEAACGRRLALEHAARMVAFELDEVLGRFCLVLEQATALTVLNEFGDETLERALLAVPTRLHTTRRLRVATTGLESLARVTCEHPLCQRAAGQATDVLIRAQQFSAMLAGLLEASDNALRAAQERARGIGADPLLVQSRSVTQDLARALQAINKVVCLLLT